MTPPPTEADAGAALVAALQRQLGARRIETHISWVLLTDALAWKIKKPLRLGFLDFGTLAERQRLCAEELRLNRRLAPSLYLDVVPIAGTPEAPEPGGAGPAIEFALRMRRFPDGALLSERLAAGTLTPAMIDRLAARLAAFHRDAPVAPAGSPYGDPGRVGADLHAVVDRLAARAPLLDAASWRAWADTEAAAHRDDWAARQRSGRVREGHGDLHLANLVEWDGDVTAFDAIEFDPALRWIDVMADIAFPVMDLEAHGRSDLAFRLLDGWLAASGDHAGLAVLRGYLAYRALVRALVDRLRPPAPGAPDYIAAAERWRAPPDARLLITEGLPGSGKSHAAAALVERCGAVRLRSDVERKRLHGLQPLEASAPDAGLYGADATRRTYAELLERAGLALRAGWRVVVDAAFLQAAQREVFHGLARRLGVPFAVLHCDAPDAQLRQRLAERARRGDDPSEADATTLDLLRRHHEPLSVGEREHAIDAGPQPDPAALAARWLALPRPAMLSQAAKEDEP